MGGQAALAKRSILVGMRPEIGGPVQSRAFHCRSRSEFEALCLAFFALPFQMRSAQPFDLVDDHGLCPHPTEIVGRHPACCLRRVLDPHCMWNQ